jgi:hypothetical protein|tara:strand:+ start:326 stop:757 length:432 start_codon:yes stop_codon:yes gene_type:complete
MTYALSELRWSIDKSKLDISIIQNYEHTNQYNSEHFAIKYLQHKFPNHHIKLFTPKIIKQHTQLLSHIELIGAPDIVILTHDYQIKCFCEVKLGHNPFLKLTKTQVLWIKKYYAIYKICLLGILDYRHLKADKIYHYKMNKVV